MSIVRKISRDVLSDQLLQEIDEKLTEDAKLSYNNLLDKPVIPEPITEVPESLLSPELQEKLNNMLSADDTVDWSQLTNVPSFDGVHMEAVKEYVDPQINRLQEEINGKMDIGDTPSKEQLVSSLASSIGATELTPDLLAIINNKMNKGAGISYSQILDPPTIVPSTHTSEVTPTNNAEIWYKIIE